MACIFAHAEEGKVINIYSPTSELEDLITILYPNYTDAKINYIELPYSEDKYSKLDETLKKQNKLPADKKVDIFVVSADDVQKYIESSYVILLKDIGITDSDLKNQYACTKNTGTASDGKLKAVTWQICPSGFIYRRSIAKEVFGTDDPDRIQEEISDWKKFDAAAEKVCEKGFYMYSSPDDTIRAFNDAKKTPWVKDGKINIDSSITNWIEMSKKHADADYISNYRMWSPAWSMEMMSEGMTFGYFGPKWFIDYSIPHEDESADGDWGFYPGPHPFDWGNSYICIAKGTDNKKFAKDLILKLCCSEDIMLELISEKNIAVNNSTAMKKHSENPVMVPFLNNQDYYPYFAKAAELVNGKNITKYDIDFTDFLLEAMSRYFDGNTSLKQAWNDFYKMVNKRYPKLKK